MSITFTKLFSSICESTVWQEPAATRLAWITMLAMADRNGRVFAAIPGLANRARISVDEAEAAINTFLSPDRYSRTKDFEGRRIEEIDGGWRLLNHAKYRDIRDEESIRESKRRYMQRTRAEAKESGTTTSTVERGGPKQRQIQKQEKKKPSGSAAPTPRGLVIKGPITVALMVDIMDAFNAALPNLSKVKVITPKRDTLIRKAWNLSIEWQDLAFWRAYFDECNDDPFLNGTGPYREPHANWRPDFDYLLRSDVIAKVYERALSRMEKGNG